MLRPISGSFISVNVCMHAIFHLSQETSRARSDRPVSCGRLSAMTPSFRDNRAKTKRIWQPCSAIKQTFISLLKTRAYTCFSFHVSLGSLRKPCLGPRVSRPIRCSVCACLPASLFAYLFAFTYSYLRFGHSFRASWYLSIWAWPQRAKSLLWSRSWR